MRPSTPRLLVRSPQGVYGIEDELHQEEMLNECVSKLALCTVALL